MANFQQQLDVLPGHLANHLMISMLALVIGAAVSLVTALIVVRRPRWKYASLTAASIVQTIPSLALLALMVPVLAGIGLLSRRWFGIEISALGFYPTVIALTLYSILPMLRNAVTAIAEIDPQLLEAARGVGMTARQMFWRVEWPLALPVIIAGVRTATVWVVGIATLATPVGQRCLGNYIFSGLQTRNWTAVLFGCVAAAGLAVLLDTLIGGVERGLRSRRSGLTRGCTVTLLMLLAVGLAAPRLVAAVRGRTGDGPVVVIGAKTFTEQYILAELIALRLERAGLDAELKSSLGSTVVFDALATGEIDCYVDYSGTIWANHMQRTGTAPAEVVLGEMTAWLAAEKGIVCLGALGFENAYGLAMRGDHARELGAQSISDLRGVAPDLKIGGDYEFFDRPEWMSIRDVYGLRFADQVSFDSTFMYDAVRRSEVDVISAFTSDGRIAAFDLRILDDPQQAIPPYDAVLLVSAAAAERTEVLEVLARWSDEFRWR